MSVSTVPETLAGTWKLDLSHSAVEFVVKHLVISNVKGRFKSFSGTLVVDESDPTRSTVEAQIDAASIDTDDEKRDAHLRSADFFEAEKYPELTFRSTAVRPRGDDRYELVGDLTIRGVTRPITLDVEFLGQARDPWGATRVGFSATGAIDRREFGLNWNAALEAGGVLVGDRVKIVLEIEAIKQ